MRIPFSSLRYKNSDPQTWAILLYRNYPRDRNYQFLSAKVPRGFNCFVCHANTLEGLQRLPTGGHFVAAPYVSSSSSRPSHGRSRIAAGERPDAAARGPRRQVHAQFGHRRGPHRQAGLLAGGVGRRADLRERTVRACSFRKSAPSSSRASICSRRRFRRSTHARSPRRRGAGGSPARPRASATPRWWSRMTAVEVWCCQAHMARRSRLRTSPRRCSWRGPSAISVARSSACS